MTNIELLSTILLDLLIVLVGLYCVFSFFTWLIDYRFSINGIEIVLFGRRFRIATLLRDRIRRAQVMTYGKYFSTDYRFIPSFSLKNRFKARFLFVETTYFIKYWSLTPRDPDAALAELGLPGLE